MASDVFGGVSNGQAFSQFAATGLTPGRYTLVTTGTSVRGAQYQIDLSTSLTPPGIPPIGSAVPEPATWIFMLFGFVAVVPCAGNEAQWRRYGDCGMTLTDRQAW